ncbi:MAG: hypothetical protein COV01_03355 [Candidatus Taylorbacteria bacterium CG10_big_fil_rev_8_21_14_0_10_41_48]|uniref:Uncharacterized protein n=1 Tax=Candidatus Taylorbacteria bacterium CG10_big_fil_rev_8_21_14_0_10_41_48 TaxID=1975024 RepID=A0A2M8LB52_9BACT|nr:MAG: hypothetical protein COV01_03355 [Candidatus Taylorbacteria bacterium CG10_big_fil_rev_8_21_14_0_10_41_48]
MHVLCSCNITKKIVFGNKKTLEGFLDKDSGLSQNTISNPTHENQQCDTRKDQKFIIASFRQWHGTLTMTWKYMVWVHEVSMVLNPLYTF